MSYLVNGWMCLGDIDHIDVLATGDNRPVPYDYLQLVPVEADNRVVGFDPPDGPQDCRWIMELANADPTGTMDILLIGGAPAADPPEIVMPPGYTQFRVTPGRTARLYYQTGIGWCILVPGALEA